MSLEFQAMLQQDEVYREACDDTEPSGVVRIGTRQGHSGLRAEVARVAASVGVDACGVGHGQARSSNVTSGGVFSEARNFPFLELANSEK